VINTQERFPSHTGGTKTTQTTASRRTTKNICLLC